LLQSLLVTSELEASQELAKHLDELNECRAREMQLLQTFRDGRSNLIKNCFCNSRHFSFRRSNH